MWRWQAGGLGVDVCGGCLIRMFASDAAAAKYPSHMLFSTTTTTGAGARRSARATRSRTAWTGSARVFESPASEPHGTSSGLALKLASRRAWELELEVFKPRTRFRSCTQCRNCSDSSKMAITRVHALRQRPARQRKVLFQTLTKP
jgi:hypothetical protein